MFKFGAFLSTAMLIVNIPAAYAGAPISLQTDQTQMIALASEPGTVVVGNPSIADVSVNGKQVFLHGRAFGSTNIIILDASGNQMASFDVMIQHDSPNDVAIFTADSKKETRAVRVSYTCAPLCQREMIPGDDYEIYKNMVAMNQLKSGLATGSKANDVAAPSAAPQ